MDLLTDWFKVNKLALNISKSNYMVIRSKGNFTLPERDLVMNGGNLQGESHIKCLGIIIDEFLDWKADVPKICRTIAPIIGILSRIWYLVPIRILRQLYYVLIHPHIMYCI